MRTCTPFSTTAAARLRRTFSGRSSPPLAVSSVKVQRMLGAANYTPSSRAEHSLEPAEEVGEIGDRLEVIVEPGRFVRGVDTALGGHYRPGHNGGYPKVGRYKRGWPAPPDGRVDDRLFCA